MQQPCTAEKNREGKHMSDVLVAVKRTKWERDLMRYISPEVVRELYAIQNNAFEGVYASHTRQLESLDRVKTAMAKARFDVVYAYREDLHHLDYYRFRIIISVGGDNHFIHVSHYADDIHLMLGINSDPATSSGALLQFDADTFAEKIAPGMDNIRFVTEKWTRINGELIYPDGRRTTTVPCTSEISIRNSYADAMSRYLIRKSDGEWEDQKSSGLILSTGAGSTGWFKNCLLLEDRKDAIFPKDADFFRFVAREPGHKRRYTYVTDQISKSESLELVSEMDGEISIDANPDRTFDFPPGCKARFFLSDNKLEVVSDIVPA